MKVGINLYTPENFAQLSVCWLVDKKSEDLRFATPSLDSLPEDLY